MANFPTSLPTERNSSSSEVLNAAAGVGLTGLLNEYSEDIVGLATKLGTGADTAASNEVLVGTGVGTSGWSSTLAGITLTSPTINTPTLTSAVAATSFDLNGVEMIIDADADTSITADTDDQIDIKIAAADDFRFTANTFTALSGSTIATNTIAETTAANGVTIDSLNIKDGYVTGSATSGIRNASLGTEAGGLGAAWQTWTPTLSGDFTDADWTKNCAYLQIGKTVFFRIELVATDATPMAGGGTDAEFTLPVTAAHSNVIYFPIGTAILWDVTGSVYSASMFTVTSLTLGKIRYLGASSVMTSITNLLPFTWTTNDNITGYGMYEAA